jgi:hypothetical protein
VARNTGLLLSLLALALKLVGNAVEVASLTFSGSESDIGHTMFLIGFLVLLVGSVLLGIAIIRTQRTPSSRIGGCCSLAPYR